MKTIYRGLTEGLADHASRTVADGIDALNGWGDKLPPTSSSVFVACKMTFDAIDALRLANLAVPARPGWSPPV